MGQTKGPEYGKLIFYPALITLGITLLRLGGEWMGLPAWLANRKAGGVGALIGISWLPPILGVYFAYKLASVPRKRWMCLLKTIFLYGLAARIPVILIMGLAIHGNWGTHYDAFPSGPLAGASRMAAFLYGGVAIQLIWWVLIWTVGSGMLTGSIALAIRSPQRKKPAALE